MKNIKKTLINSSTRHFLSVSTCIHAYVCERETKKRNKLYRTVLVFVLQMYWSHRDAGTGGKLLLVASLSAPGNY